MHIKLGILLVGLTSTQFLCAQGISQTPYAQFGFGDVETLTNTRLEGMGGAGTSLVNPYQINFKNPASAAYNRQYVIFEAGFYGQNANLATETKKQQILSGNINYLALLIPLSAKNWTLIAGLAPYSNANTKYNILSKTVFPTDAPVQGRDSATVNNFKTIDGGLNQVFITNAIKLPKGFSLGLTTSLVLGTINRKNEGVEQNFYRGFLENPSTKTVIRSKEVYRFIDFKLGIGYHKVVSSKYAIGIGATGTFNQVITANRELINSINSNNLTSAATGYLLYSDTVSQDNLNAKLPSVYTFGFNFENINKWNIALDYAYTDYSRYKSFDPTNVFSSGHRVTVGTEFIPSYDAIKGYLKRVVYRFGGYYNQTPLKVSTPAKVEGTQILDVGGTIGLGLPVGKGGIGMLNLAVAVGRRGTTDHGLVAENYFRFFVGLNVNDRWFVRYKVE